MRMMPSRYASGAQPLKAKKVNASIQHLAAPLKGLDLSSASTPGDPLTATVLDNWIIEDNEIRVRPGIFLRQTLPVVAPVEMLIPFFGVPSDHAAATSTTIYSSDNVVLAEGFTSGDWAWTHFSNLSQQKFTIIANGRQGVWAWDGGEAPRPAPTTTVTLTSGTPVTCTVPAGEITKYIPGRYVFISGATGALSEINGLRLIGPIAGDTFPLMGTDVPPGTIQTTGLTAETSGSLEKQPLTAPAGAFHIVPDSIDKVLSHMQRLWFADQTNLSVYYLPLQQKAGELAEIPMNAIFKRGGVIRAIHNWSIDGGDGMDDKLVVFTSNGECAIYQGIDPDTDMALQGVFRFNSPITKNCVMNYGGDVFVLTATGLLPLTTLMRAETEKLSKGDSNVFPLFHAAAEHRDQPGWKLLNDQTGARMLCNVPDGAPNRYRQILRQMPANRWSTWSNLPSRTWLWISDSLWCGSDDGKVYEMNDRYFSDNGVPITADVQTAWSTFKTVSIKHFKMVLPYITTDGLPRPYVEMKLDYDTSPPMNQPETTTLVGIGAVWDEADWDVSDWAQTPRQWNNWTGAKGIGRVGAARVRVSVNNCMFTIAGFDVIYETGAPFG